MSNAKLAAARELIEEKKYYEARTLLFTIKEDPTAAKWLMQLNQRIIAEESTRALPATTDALPSNYTVMPQSNSWEDDRTYYQNSSNEPIPKEKASGAGCFRVVWGVLTLLSLAWIAFGFFTSAHVTGNQLNTTQAQASDAYQAGTLIGGGLSITFFLCSGLPFLILFGLLYWRNGVAIREARKHNQMIAAIQNHR